MSLPGPWPSYIPRVESASHARAYPGPAETASDWAGGAEMDSSAPEDRSKPPCRALCWRIRRRWLKASCASSDKRAALRPRSECTRVSPAPGTPFHWPLPRRLLLVPLERALASRRAHTAITQVSLDPLKCMRVGA